MADRDKIRDMVMALSRGDHEAAQQASSEVMASKMAKSAELTEGNPMRARMNRMGGGNRHANMKRGAERGVRGRSRIREYDAFSDPDMDADMDSMGMARQDYGYNAADDPEFQDADAIQRDIDNLTMSLDSIVRNGGRNSKPAKNIRAAIEELKMKAKPHTDPEVSHNYNDDLGDDDMMDRGTRDMDDRIS